MTVARAALCFPYNGKYVVIGGNRRSEAQRALGRAEIPIIALPADTPVEKLRRIAFNAVGFSSPPSWLKPYSVLSNGEKMRCDLARAMLSGQKLFVFDEFTSVVDRTIAKIGSFAMQKAVRRTGKQFIAVTCHFDVEEWLMPDWVFDTNTMTFRDCGVQKKIDRPLNSNCSRRKTNNSIGKCLRSIII